MKKNKQSNESSPAEQQSILQEQEMDQLAELLCVKSAAAKAVDQDPFSCYTESLQAKFHSDPRHFKSRFVKGYHALLEQLQADGISQTKKSL